ncbi:MAG: hypothetical protein Q9187_006280 [Circinaria calcarea]
MATVIIGAGIIGSSTAYYLSESSSTTPPSSIHLIESCPELFASASGYAAGFLARDWFEGSVAPLGALSFDLHKQLAEENNGWEKWGYSRSTGTSLVSKRGERGEAWFREGNSRAESAGAHEFVSGKGPAWLAKRNNGKVEVISEGDSTAQVFVPALYAYFPYYSSRGVHLHQPARPISISKSPAGVLSSIRIASTTNPSHATDIPCTRLIVTAGAWTSRVFRTLFPASRRPTPIIGSLAGYSLLIRSPRWKTGDDKHAVTGGCHAVFATDERGYSPEVFSRVGGEIYIAGLNSASMPLPEIATDRQIDERSIGILKNTARRLLGSDEEDGDDDLEILREGLCFRPVTERGTPVVGKMADARLGLGKGGGKEGEGEGGVWVAAGHGPWGISLSLGTGKCVAEMVEGREMSADVGGLRP